MVKVPLMLPTSAAVFLLLSSPEGPSLVFSFPLALLVCWCFQYLPFATGGHPGHGFLSLLTGLFVILFAFFYSTSLFSFYVFFEASLIPTVLLIFRFGYQPEKLQASLFLLLYTVLASLPLFFFILTYPFPLALTPSAVGRSQILCVSVAFIVKTPIFLVHLWLPKAHVEAPVGGSIVLAGVLLKLGTYGLFTLWVGIASPFLVLLLAVSLVGATVGALICLRQGDIKALIAYSSIVHIAGVTAAIVVGSELGYLGALAMCLRHGIRSPLCFLLAFQLYQSSHSRLLTLNGNLTTSPLANAFFFLVVLTNIGGPPFLNL